MMTLVIYDIEDDRVRSRISEACKDYGLRRVQKSAFRGELNTNRREMLYQRLEQTLARRAGNIHIYALCDRDAKEVLTIEQEARDEHSTDSGRGNNKHSTDRERCGDGHSIDGE
jgi:CRISPR-associated protein Cas2